MENTAPAYPHEIASLTINIDSDLVRVAFDATESHIDPSASHMLFINGEEWLPYAHLFFTERLTAFNRILKGIPQGQTEFKLCFTHPLDTGQISFWVYCLEA